MEVKLNFSGPWRSEADRTGWEFDLHRLGQAARQLGDDGWEHVPYENWYSPNHGENGIQNRFITEA
jgi:hypothetical protein